MATEPIKTREQFMVLLKDAWPEMIRQDPQLLLTAFGGNRDQLVDAFRKLGFFVSTEQADPAGVIAAHRNAIQEGTILTGFGARTREQCRTFARQVKDPFSGREKVNYLWGDQKALAERWFRAFFAADKRDPETGDGLREITARLNDLVRAPATPLTAEKGTAGGFLIPTLIAAQIFEEKNERFVLRSMVEVFVSAAPLEIPRRTSQVTVTRKGPANDLDESVTDILGAVTLAAQRLGAFAYIDPQVALASAAGPIAYFTRQFGEALAKDAQRVIVAGETGLREPRGINTLPTSGGNAFDRAKTATWTNTDRDTRRRSIRKLYYAVQQEHRESDRFVWITNNDGVQVMADLNDQNQRPFEDAAPGGFPTYLRRRVVETTAIVTASSETSILEADMGQYAWLESPVGMELETTREGGKAWESHTIGVKVVEHIDGAPVVPPAFGKMSSVNI